MRNKPSTVTLALIEKIWLSLSIGLFAAAPVAAASFEIKGIGIGSSEEDVQAAVAGVTCKEASRSRAPMRICLGDVSYAGVESSIFVTFLDGKADFISVGFPATNWPHVRDAIQAKYRDETTNETSIVQNRMGASFDQQTLTWIDGDETMRAVKRSQNDLTESMVDIVSESALIERTRRAQEEAKSAAGDL